jgi:membrane-associated phospholipid phosphatase
VTVLVIALACGLAAAAAAFAVSFSQTIHIDPIDPAAQERAVRRSIGHHPKVRRFVRQRMDRTAIGGFMLSAGFAVVFGVAMVLGLMLTLIDHSTTLREIDDSVAEWGSRHATAQSVDFIKFVTNFGATPVVLTALLVAAAIDFTRRRNPSVFAFALSVGLGELLLNNLIKVLVQRDRPAVLHLMEAGGYSFPSGHSAAAAAGWSGVALILGRNRPRRVRAVLASAAALIAMTVATSRALLGVHWVSDVVSGLALGWGWFLLVAVVFGGRRQRLGDPVAGLAEERHESDPVERGASVDA